MRTKTLAQLRLHALRIADAENDAHITREFVDAELNNAATRLYGKLLHRAGEELYRSAVDVTATPGEPDLVIPGGYVRLAGVVWVKSPDDQPKLDRITWGEYLERGASSGWGEGGHICYVPGNAKLTLWPTPDAAHVVRVHRVPSYSEMVADGDTFEGINGYEEIVLLETAIAIRDRKRESTSGLLGRLQRVRDDFAAEWAEQDQLDPQYARDVERGIEGHWFRERS